MYNDQQKDIINDNSTKLAVFAVAGSGKSTTLAGKVETVLNQGIMPSKIAVITFTNDASDSILKKVESKGLDTQGLMNKTLHGFCYYLLKTCNDFSGEKTPTILSDSEKSFGFHFWKLASVYKNIPSKNYKDWLSFCYNIKAETLQEPDVLIKKEFGMTPDALKQKIIKEEIRDRNSFAYLMYYEYTAWKKSLNQIDFLDIIVESIYALRKADERCLNFIKSKWNYIFVDECQDTNFLVIEVLKLITKPETNVVFLGDIRQCQPEGNNVLLSDGTEVDISKIKVGDKLDSYVRKCGYFRKKFEVDEVAVRKYTGDIFKISVNGKTTSTTDTHKFIAKWNIDKKTSNLHCVYLMRRGNNFRIGWCKLFENTGNFHLSTRSRIENADSWILKIVETKEEASLLESIISTNFGLPLFMFNPVPSNRIYTRKNLDFMWSSLKNNYNRGLLLLKSFNKSELHPFFKYTIKETKQRTTVFETQACNLFPKYMSLPIKISDSVNAHNREWATIDSIEIENVVDLNVYSLSVKDSKTYISNGIGTCNSIYGFNFAKPEYILDYVRRAGFIQKSLNINYRSSEEIVDNANYFIGHYPECNVGGDAISHKGKIGYPVCSIRSTDEIMETDTVVDQITKLVSQDGFTYDDISILYRTHSQSMMLLNWCVNYNIPFQIKSDSKSIFDRPEMKDILAYLKIFNEFSKTKKADFKRIANKPVRYITNSAMDDLDFQDNKVGFGDWFMEKYHRNEKMEILKADIRAYMRRTSEMPLQDQITFVLQEGGVGYQKWWENSENSDKFFDLALYANTLGQLAKSYPTYREFIAQINKIREAIRNSENEGIKFYSIHASKGLEFPVTFILGVCDRMYPFYRAVQEGNRDEEARLFYVASTRPEKRLYYSEILGTLGKIRVKQSPFIDQTYRNVINEDFYSLN